MKSYCVIAQRGGWKWIHSWHGTYRKAYLAATHHKAKGIQLHVLARVQGSISNVDTATLP